MIPLPQKPKVILEEGNRGVYEIEGLYPGYGVTIGNSLRRVLLSSLKGAVITSVMIENVAHEFSTVPGVLENIVDIILNLKQVRFKIHDEGPHKITLDVKGEKGVVASDFTIPSQLELVTPEVIIATLTDKKAELKMEADVESGLGYRSVESRRKEKSEVGLIVLDASFSPVRSMNYEIENMRVGDRTDYNRLRLHIVTDGSITPHEALRNASAILVEQFGELSGIFTEKEKEREREKETKEVLFGEAEPEAAFEDEVSKRKIEDLNLSTRIKNSLNSAGIRNIGALARKTEKKLMEVEGLGAGGMREIKRELGNLGLTLKQ